VGTKGETLDTDKEAPQDYRASSRPYRGCITGTFGWPPSSYPPEKPQNLKEDKVRLSKGSLPRVTPCALRRRVRQRCELVAILDLLPQNHLP